MKAVDSYGEQFLKTAIRDYTPTKRQGNDCGVLALAALTGLPHAEALKVARKEAHYRAHIGTPLKFLMNTLKSRANGRRFYRFGAPITLDELMRRKGNDSWTGVIVVCRKDGRGWHAAPVVNGTVLNVSESDFLTYIVVGSMRTDYNKTAVAQATQPEGITY